MRQLRLRSHFFYKADNLKLQRTYSTWTYTVLLKTAPVVCNQPILKHFILNLCLPVTALPHDRISRNTCRLSGLRSVEPLCEVSGCGCEDQHAPTISMSQYDMRKEWLAHPKSCIQTHPAIDISDRKRRGPKCGLDACRQVSFPGDLCFV